jgi:hypothetical protein
MSGSEPEPSPPTVNDFVTMSSQVFTGEVCQATNTLVSLVPLPSQVNFVASNCTLVPPIKGSIAMPRLKVPMVRPSFGATL